MASFSEQKSTMYLHFDMGASSYKNKPTEPQNDCLRDSVSFPLFRDLPNDYEVDKDYYAVCKHWCFIAEIVDTEFSLVPFFYNNLTIVKDKFGKYLPVYFYPKKGSFDFHSLQKGHMIAVFYAERHYFFDGKIGLRIEAMDSIRVIKCSLNELLEVSRLHSKGHRICWNCEMIAKEEDFKKCSACGVASYCGKECQVKDWKERHKRICKEMKKFLKLTEVCKKATVGKYLSWD